MSRDLDTAKKYLDTALLLGRTVSSTNLQGRLLNDQAYYYNRTGNYAKAEGFYLQAIDSFEKAGNLGMLQVANNVLGVVRKNRGKLDEALQAYMSSLAISDSLGDTDYYRAPTFLNIGVLLAEMGDLKRSNEYYQKTIVAGETFNIPWGKAIAQSNMATNYVSEGRLEEALEVYLKALEFFEKEKYDLESGEQYGHIGTVYLKLGDMQQAEVYFKKSMAMGTRTGDIHMQVSSLRQLGMLYRDLGQPARALGYQLEALDLAREADNNVEKLFLLKDIGDTYAASGDFEKAYTFRKQHHLQYDSTFQKEKVAQINELEVRFRTAQKEAEIALQKEEIKTLNEKAKVENLTTSLYAGGMFSFLAISGGLFFGFRQKIKRNRIAREKQEEIYRKEIEHKKKELASQTLHLVQKNTFLEELEGNLENLRKSPDTFKMEFRRIAMLLKKEKASDRDWDTFKTYFSQVHNDFDQKLKTLSDAISEKEIRLAAFLRMNLTTKEIAATMNVLPESVLKSKYRLKKKLGLARDTDLNEFLETL